MMMRSHRPMIMAKLNVPTPRDRYIPRPDLMKRLDRIVTCKVTVIQGVPGSGKSTLMAAYASGCPPAAVRWISLDATDNDLRTFWSYVLESLRPDLGRKIDRWRELVDTTWRSEDVRTVLVDVVNAFQPQRDIVIVLDDMHYITDPRLVDSIEFFLRYSSERVRFVLLTREAPALSLGDWRMAGLLLEIDNDDLQVNKREARQFLIDTMGLHLNDDVIRHMTHLSEGWIGGLQLLGLALEHREVPEGTVQSLGRPVVDYLTGEILDALTVEQRHFLICTSILDYFDASACRAVVARDDAPDILKQMVAANVFIVTVDERRGLYRYHHLFRQFLHRRFMEMLPEDRHVFHRRAAEFYRSQHRFEQSVHHDIQAERYDRVLTLIRDQSGGVTGWRWLQSLPLHALEGNPDLIYQRLFSHMAEQQLDECGRVYRHFQGTFSDPLADNLFDLFAAVIDHDDVDRMLEPWSPQDVHELELSDETKVILYSMLSVALTMKDREREALACLDESDRNVTGVKNPYIRYYAYQLKGQVKEYLGHLQACEDIFSDMFRLIRRHPFLRPISVTAHMSVAGVLLKMGRLDEARAHLDEVKPRTAHNTPLNIAYLYNKMEYCILKGRHDWAVDVARRLVDLGLMRHALYQASMLRYLLLLGEVDEEGLARYDYRRSAKPSLEEDLLEVALALRRGEITDALALIDARLAQRSQRQSPWSLVNALLAKVQLLITASTEGVVASKGHGGREKKVTVTRGSDRHLAADVFREAVRHSYKNRIVAPFLLAGPRLLPLVQRLMQDDRFRLHKEEAAFLERLLTHWAAGRDGSEDAALQHELSRREIEVLEVLAEGTTNRQIADRLYISLATVKTHMVNIYSKLGVSNRVAAVEEARRLGIVK